MEVDTIKEINLSYLENINAIIKEIKVRELEAYVLKDIPERYYDETVYILCNHYKNKPPYKASYKLRKLMNRRFVFYQLELIDRLQEMSNREMWYFVEIMCGGQIDYGAKKPYKDSFIGQVKNFLKAIAKLYDIEYWGDVYELLKITAKARAMIYDSGKKIPLDIKAVPKYTEVPFFFIICEKEDILRAMLKEIENRGYYYGFIGINTEGMGTTNVIKLIREYSEVKNFHCFVSHDLDISGLNIYLNLKRHFNCDSIGVNPKMLDSIGIKFNDVCEKYNKKYNIKGHNTTLENANLNDTERKEIKEWSKMCRYKKVELNCITAHRLYETPHESKVKDLVDYFEVVLQEKEWNLNRYRKPEYTEIAVSRIYIYYPQLSNENRNEYTQKATRIKLKLTSHITRPIREIERKANEVIKDYLDKKGLATPEDWDNLISETTRKMENGNTILHNILDKFGIIKQHRLIHKNKRYKGSIKKASDVIKNQTKQLDKLHFKQRDWLEKRIKRQNKICERLIKRSPEYRETKKRLTEIKNRVIKILKSYDIGDENKSNN